MAPAYTSELDRQRAYLAKLPDDFQYPLFNTKQALMSQRNNGYRNTAVAAREIIDNALEADATRIDVVLKRVSQKKLEKHQRKDTVDAVAFIDNGSGMIPEMARYAMSWGGGTHFEDPSEIGKFGFGLPNASINQTRKVSVYTRTSPDEDIVSVRLDLDEAAAHGLQTIPEPKTAKLPAFVTAYMDKNDLTFEKGTIVVWEQPDRLSYRTAGSLRPHLTEDFGAAYRNFLDEVEIHVDGAKVQLVDPLFLNPNGRYYLDPKKGGAIKTQDVSIPVVLYKDLESGNVRLKRLASEKDLDDLDEEQIIIEDHLHVKVARLPYGFAVDKAYAKKDVERRRFDIRKERRGLSFVRADREIETVDNFPRSAQDIASGLGKWPLLQGYAYHWGAEVQFSPDLDDALGITNDKQNVRPTEDFWRVLAEEGVDKWLGKENAWQSKTRRDARKAEKAKDGKKSEDESKPSAGQSAAAAASAAAGSKNTVPPRDQETAAKAEDAAVKVESKKTGKPEKDVRKTIRERAKKQPYRIEFFADDYAPFYVPEWGGGNQIVIKINTKHPFHGSLYSKLFPTPADGDVVVRHAIDLMLFALSRSELATKNDDTAALYKTQRSQKWSPFLENALAFMERQFESGDAEQDDDDGATDDADGDAAADAA